MFRIIEKRNVIIQYHKWGVGGWEDVTVYNPGDAKSKVSFMRVLNFQP